MVVIRDLTRLDAFDGHRSVHDCNDFRLSVFHEYHLLSLASVSAEIECSVTAGPDARFGGWQFSSELTNPSGRMWHSHFSRTTARARSGSGIMFPALARSSESSSRRRSMKPRSARIESSVSAE